MSVIRAFLLVVGAAIWAAANAPAQEVLDREYQIKAAYLYNFGLYVDWPKDAMRDQTFVIGVLGANPFEKNLDQLAEAKKVGERKIVVRYFKSADDFKPCNILFISGSTGKGPKDKSPLDRLKAVLKSAQESSTLVVTESKGLAEKGAAINFFIEGNRVRFEINPKAAKRSKLQLKAKLLQLGTLIEE